MGNHFAAEVKLEHDVYYPGNVVRGAATIRLDEPKKCIAGRIMCRGLERSIVMRNAGEYSHPVSQDVVFYKETLTLFGHPTHDSDQTPVEVPAGTYTYPFAFELPAHLPGSIHLTNWSWGGAEVKYAVIAYLKLDTNHIDEGHSEFTVITPVNERDARNSQAVEASETIKLKSLLSDQGTCDVKVVVARSLFSADDVIEGTIAIDNTRGHIDIHHYQVAVQCRCDSFVDQYHSGFAEGMRGGAFADAVVKKKSDCNVAKGTVGTATFSLKLPHVITSPSYPARGMLVTFTHEITVEIAGGKIKLPIHIAHCCDNQNRFAFCPPNEICHKPEHKETEHAYNAPEGYAASPCPALQPPGGLSRQAVPSASTPQATGTGLLHA